jgi:hypothetical protein
MAEEISRQQNMLVVAWVSLADFSQIYSWNQEQSKKFEKFAVWPEKE